MFFFQQGNYLCSVDVGRKGSFVCACIKKIPGDRFVPVQVWASTKPGKSQLKKSAPSGPLHSARCTGGPINENSVFALILNELSVNFQSGAPLPLDLVLCSDTVARPEVDLQSEPQVLHRHRSQMNAAVARSLQQWWGDRAADVSAVFGFEVAAHVHAAAASAAAANIAVGKLASDAALRPIDLAAVHSLAFKIVCCSSPEMDELVRSVVHKWVQCVGGPERLCLHECWLLTAARYSLQNF